MRITTQEDVARGVIELVRIDVRLRPLVERSSVIPLRRVKPGFEGLAHIIVSQLVSRASANAIWNRICENGELAGPDYFQIITEDARKKYGLTRAKASTLSGIANAIVNRELDLATLAVLPGEEALSRLTSFKGIGPWTAEVYLIFCCGHPDIFPVGDVALRTAVTTAFGMDKRVSQAELAAEAEKWSPWRSIAARIFWAFYATQSKRDALPV